ncbi:MAG: hypothetical protein ACP5NF_11560 [Thermoanaerobaculum sp.]
MKWRDWTLELATPAFLGGADKSSEWRTASLKTLIRRWWRIVHAREIGYCFHKLREDEGRLLGHSWLEDSVPGAKKTHVWSFRSPIVVRLEPLDGSWRGTLLRHQWRKVENEKLKVDHPWVTPKKTMERSSQGGARISPLLYLGYGPVGAGTITVPSALQPGSKARILLVQRSAANDHFWNDELPSVFEGIALFGTIGSRSRNGWGSLILVPDTLPNLDQLRERLFTFANKFSRPLDECLQEEWPHAIARVDSGMGVWILEKPQKTWQEAMAEIARLKIAIYTQLDGCGSFPKLEENTDWKHYPEGARLTSRHIMSYPVTNHGVAGWVRERDGKPERSKDRSLRQTGRLPNQLVFKVHKVRSGNGVSYVAVAVHLAHKIPGELINKLKEQPRKSLSSSELLELWSEVHGFIDDFGERRGTPLWRRVR